MSMSFVLYIQRNEIVKRLKKLRSLKESSQTNDKYTSIQSIDEEEEEEEIDKILMNTLIVVTISFCKHIQYICIQSIRKRNRMNKIILSIECMNETRKVKLHLRIQKKKNETKRKSKYHVCLRYLSATTDNHSAIME